jgi:hypothetical protein
MFSVQAFFHLSFQKAKEVDFGPKKRKKGSSLYKSSSLPCLSIYGLGLFWASRHPHERSVARPEKKEKRKKAWILNISKEQKWKERKISPPTGSPLSLLPGQPSFYHAPTMVASDSNSAML